MPRGKKRGPAGPPYARSMRPDVAGGIEKVSGIDQASPTPSPTLRSRRWDTLADLVESMTPTEDAPDEALDAASQVVRYLGGPAGPDQQTLVSIDPRTQHPLIIPSLDGIRDWATPWYEGLTASQRHPSPACGWEVIQTIAIHLGQPESMWVEIEVANLRARMRSALDEKEDHLLQAQRAHMVAEEISETIRWVAESLNS